MQVWCCPQALSPFVFRGCAQRQRHGKPKQHWHAQRDWPQPGRQRKAFKRLRTLPMASDTCAEPSPASPETPQALESAGSPAPKAPGDMPMARGLCSLGRRDIYKGLESSPALRLPQASQNAYMAMDTNIPSNPAIPGSSVPNQGAKKSKALPPALPFAKVGAQDTLTSTCTSGKTANGWHCLSSRLALPQQQAACLILRSNQVKPRRLGTPKSSTFLRVSWRSSGRKWYACIKCNGRTQNLGYYTEEVEAARAYDAEARKVRHIHNSRYPLGFRSSFQLSKCSC